MVDNWIQSEEWQPSAKLRFVKRKVNDYSKKTIGDKYLQKDANILQQLYTSNLGNKEWKDIPLETES